MKKTEGRKSRETVPLKLNYVKFQFFQENSSGSEEEETKAKNSARFRQIHTCKTCVLFHLKTISRSRTKYCISQCCGSGSGRIRTFLSDPDVWDRIRFRIRILALINGPISTFLVCVKAINTLGLPVA
jgi:hypothetical protein